MPATYAHYQFGKLVYKALLKEIQTIIKENKAAYLLGLHGPDLVEEQGQSAWRADAQRAGD